MIEGGLKIFADIIIGEVVKKIREGIESPATKSIEPLLSQMDRIESKAEAQLLIHLRAGLTFLRLNDPSQAVVELVRAEAADKLAAVSSFWLGAALGLCGRQADASRFLERALYLNPFLVNGSICTVTSQISSSKELPPGCKSDWEYDIARLRRGSNIKPSWRPAWTVPITSAATISASMSGEIPILNCQVGYIYNERDESCTPFYKPTCVKVLAAFSIDGNLKWAIKSSDDLVFSSESLVVTQSIDEKRIRLIDISTGKLLTDMSQDYFRTAFCPNFSAIKTSPAFGSTNSKFLDRMAALVKAGGSGIDGYRGKKPPVNGEFREEILLRSLKGETQLRIINQWTHQRILYPRAMIYSNLDASSNITSFTS